MFQQLVKVMTAQMDSAQTSQLMEGFMNAMTQMGAHKPEEMARFESAFTDVMRNVKKDQDELLKPKD